MYKDYIDLDEYPGYRVTKFGEILSEWKRIKNQFNGYYRSGFFSPLKGGLDKDGYRKIILCKEGKRYYKRFHLIVLEAYKGKRPKGMVGCHNDGNKLNNNIENLRYDTQYNNFHDKKKHGTYQIGDLSPRRILKEKDVIEIREKYNTKKYNRKELSEQYKVSVSTINAIIYKINWKHI